MREHTENMYRSKFGSTASTTIGTLVRRAVLLRRSLRENIPVVHRFIVLRGFLHGCGYGILDRAVIWADVCSMHAMKAAYSIS